VPVAAVRAKCRSSSRPPCSTSACPSRRLNLAQSHPDLRFSVIPVEGVTSGGQTIARCGRAIAESAADLCPFQICAFEGVAQQLRIAQSHAPDADDVDPLLAQDCLGNLGKEVLQVTVA